MESFSSQSRNLYDGRIAFPFRLIAAGGSGCGKTTFCMKLLQMRDIVTSNANCNNVIYYYNQHQPQFDALEDGVVTKFIRGLPTLEEIQNETHPFKDSGGSIVVIDDFAHLINKDILELFSVWSHHGNCSVVLLSQFLYDSRNPLVRQISMNSTCIVIFKNPRDKSQITTFAKQFSPENTKWIIECFRKATTYPYSYLLFDNHQETPDEIRVRSKIFPNESPVVVYQPKE